jgi:hypothetical protein
MSCYCFAVTYNSNASSSVHTAVSITSALSSMRLSRQVSTCICHNLRTNRDAVTHCNCFSYTALRNTERAKSVLQACVAGAILASATQGHDTLAYVFTGVLCFAASVVSDKLIQLFYRYEFNHQDNE